ncbi:MAG: hypothetical protein KTV16_11760 [Acidimicrobiia bacterium]|nr:hypothetical protein [Acidimicrobiia bacterium]
MAKEDVTYEVIAPSSQDARDFPQRVAELLRTVAIAEDRSELDLLRELDSIRYDIQYVHTHSSSPPGTAPLRDAASAFATAHAMLAASTASFEEPRLVLPSRKPRRTVDLMESVLAGPTSEGSYVISIWVPVPPRLTEVEDLVLFDESSEPFARRATKHLHRALLAARAAASEARDRGDVLDAFIAREDSGLSANLCEALVSLSGAEAAGFDVRFSWSLDWPTEYPNQQISFDQASIPVFREAASALRSESTEDEIRFHGNVVRLHREGQFGRGEVTVLGSVVGDPVEKRRHVSLDLSQPDYELAIQAHQNFANIAVGGSLSQKGNRTYMNNAREFVIEARAD